MPNSQVAPDPTTAASDAGRAAWSPAQDDIPAMSECPPCTNAMLLSAVRRGSFLEAKEILENAENKQEMLDWRPHNEDELPDYGVKYKGRQIYGQAIHAALVRPEDKDGTRECLVELLLHHKANPEAKAFSSCGLRELQPMHMAAGAGSIKSMELLLARGDFLGAEARCMKRALTNVTNASGDFDAAVKPLSSSYEYHYIPIHDAVWFGRYSAAEWLLERMSPELINKGNNDGWTALHLAAFLRHSHSPSIDRDLLKLLLVKKADHKKTDKKQGTPLMVALEKGDREATTVLLKMATQDGCVESELLAAIISKEGPRWADVLESVLSNPEDLFQEWVTEGETLAVDFWEWGGEARLASKILAVPIEVYDPIKNGCLRQDKKGKEHINKTLRDHQDGSAPKVRADVSVFPGKLKSGKHPTEILTDKHVIRAIANTRNQEVLTTTFVNAVIAVAFDLRYEWWSNVLNILICLAAVVATCVCSLVVNPTAELIALIVLGVAVGKRTCDEAWQFVHRFPKRGEKDAWKTDRANLLSISSIIDWGSCALGIVGFTYLNIEARSVVGKGFMALFFFQRWILFLYSLRGLEMLGPRLLPIIYAVKDTALFFCVLFTFLLGFTHVYFVIGPGDVTNFSTTPLYTAFFRTYNFGVLNQFAIGDLEGNEGTSSEEYVLIQIFFFLVTVSVNIVLMQLLIGVLNKSYETYMDQREELFIRERANMILDVREAPLFRLRKLLVDKLKASRLSSYFSFCQKHDDIEECRPILFVLHRAVDNTRSIEERIMESVTGIEEKIKESVTATVTKRFEGIEEKITESVTVTASMSQRFEKIEQMLANLQGFHAPPPAADAPPMPGLNDVSLKETPTPSSPAAAAEKPNQNLSP